MTAFKKYVRSKGKKLECDYPFMPYNLGGGPTIESVIVDSEAATVTTVYVVGIATESWDRSGRISFDFD